MFPGAGRCGDHCWKRLRFTSQGESCCLPSRSRPSPDQRGTAVRPPESLLPLLVPPLLLVPPPLPLPPSLLPPLEYPPLEETDALPDDPDEDDERDEEPDVDAGLAVAEAVGDESRFVMRV